MSALHQDPRHRACVREMKGRGRWQKCITCPKLLDSTAPRRHPQHMTLGHHIAVEDAPELAFVASNYGPQCEACNYGDGARRTNAKRRGVGRQLTTSPDWT